MNIWTNRWLMCLTGSGVSAGCLATPPTCISTKKLHFRPVRSALTSSSSSSSLLGPHPRCSPAAFWGKQINPVTPIIIVTMTIIIITFCPDSRRFCHPSLTHGVWIWRAGPRMASPVASSAASWSHHWSVWTWRDRDGQHTQTGTHKETNTGTHSVWYSLSSSSVVVQLVAFRSQRVGVTLSCTQKTCKWGGHPDWSWSCP